jgi:RNA polymerase sigma-70 factor (ECF subfamily)
MDDEADLIRRSASGDTDAFGRLVEVHQGRVRAYIGSYVREPDLVDDLAQEAFLSAFGDIATFRGDSTFGSWLLGIARHRVLRHLRSSTRGARFLDALLHGPRLERLEEDDRRLAEREAAIARLQSCLDRLPPSSSEIVTEHYFRACSLAELSRRMSKGESALRMMLLRIRRALRDCMERPRAPEPS